MKTLEKNRESFFQQDVFVHDNDKKGKDSEYGHGRKEALAQYLLENGADIEEVPREELIKHGCQLILNDHGERKKMMIFSRKIRYKHPMKGCGFSVDRHLFFGRNKRKNSLLFKKEADIVVFITEQDNIVTARFVRPELLFAYLSQWDNMIDDLIFNPAEVDESYESWEASRASVESNACVCKYVKPGSRQMNRTVIPIYLDEIIRLSHKVVDITRFV